MPAEDPSDQQAARTIEFALREAVTRPKRLPIELEWFAALPKRIRRSGRLLEAALAKSHVLLDHVRAAWTKACTANREQCLRAPDPAAWNGLGRRKNRCRAFDAVGRAFTTGQRLSQPEVPGEPRTVPLLSVERVPSPAPSPSPPPTPDIPTRPSTPEGLREAAFGCVGLLASASGVNAYGHKHPRYAPPYPTFNRLQAEILSPTPAPLPVSNEFMYLETSCRVILDRNPTAR
ncbi:hypothetical protein FRC07_012306 [Ceratobasidium sp. 392]|nr:hypothetical protein FRC07_012306 [Ceratobasidium sp. 392]